MKSQSGVVRHLIKKKKSNDKLSANTLLIVLKTSSHQNILKGKSFAQKYMLEYFPFHIQRGGFKAVHQKS